MNKKGTDRIQLVGFVILCVGIFLCLGGYNDYVLLKHSKTSPQLISAAKLAEARSADNWHVQITEYSIEQPLIVLKGSDIDYLECYLIPNEPSKNRIRVRNELVHTEADADKFLKQDTIVGFLRPPTDLESDRLFDFESVVRVKITTYPTADQCTGMASWGAGLIMFGVILLGFLRWRERVKTI